jgi:hypothetical protein
MFKILGEYYYIDLDAIESFTSIDSVSGETENQVHLVKYETVKFMLEIVMEHPEEVDEKMGLNSSELPLPFKLAFNTLLIKKIINKL